MSKPVRLTIATHIQSNFLFDPHELKIISSREVPTEHEEQRAFISWWRKSLPECWIFAVPNGGGRSAREGGRLKMEGVSPGVPDLVCPALCLYIEFKKRKGGSISADQKKWHAHLKACGYAVIVPKGADEAVEMLKKFISSYDKKRCTQTIDWVDL